MHGGRAVWARLLHDRGRDRELLEAARLDGVEGRIQRGDLLADAERVVVVRAGGADLAAHALHGGGAGVDAERVADAQAAERTGEEGVGGETVAARGAVAHVCAGVEGEAEREGVAAVGAGRGGGQGGCWDGGEREKKKKKKKKQKREEMEMGKTTGGESGHDGDVEGVTREGGCVDAVRGVVKYGRCIYVWYGGY